MKNNQNEQKCCPEEDNACVQETRTKCAENAIFDYCEILSNEKEEEGEPFEWCDWDPSEVYFMQHRSKKAFYNEWWKDNLYKNPYDINSHKYKNVKNVKNERN